MRQAHAFAETLDVAPSAVPLASTSTPSRTPAASPAAAARRPRLQALDAVRGFAIVIMLLVMNPGATEDLPSQLHHPDWHGFTFADLALPLFLFAAGFSMTLSRRALASRHMARRVGLLAVFGVLLATLKHEDLTWTGVLQHIAGSYLLAWAVLRLPRRMQLPVAIGIVAAVWIAFVAYRAGADPWASGHTLADAVDGTLLGGFTTEGTLQTILGSGTVLAGAFVGRFVAQEGPDPSRLVWPLARWSVLFVGVGLALAEVVPINKHLWTPSYAVLTIGTSLTMLALGLWLIDGCGLRRATRPLVHLGANPIAVYLGAMVVLFSVRNYAPDLLPDLAPAGSPLLGAILYAAAWLALWWLVARTLHRRRIFVRI